MTQVTRETWSDQQLMTILTQKFGYEGFRDGQFFAVKQLLSGRDLVLVMPTGSGKSLCYQFTALLLPGITIVISPLIALMKDQVDALVERGIKATYLNSTVDGTEMGHRLRGMRSGYYKLVYVAPERFRNRRFIEALAQTKISLFTVDEAHCISQWGHDFRPDYLNLKNVLVQLGPLPVLAVTATATPDVRQDIVKQLGLGQAGRARPLLSVTGFQRKNLNLSVKRCPTHKHKLRRVENLVSAQRCGIVYCATRRMVERVAQMLQESGAQPISYHGAMSDLERERAQNRFMQEATPLVVATNAFGMGVDRGDLRFVVHWDMPGSLEAYYQEIGRAGRDGEAAYCELLFNYADVATQRFFLEGANPQPADIQGVLATVRHHCGAADEGAVTCTIEEWKQLAGVKNEMAVRTILALIERAGLIRREILPGNRSYTTWLTPDVAAGESNLAKLTTGLAIKCQNDENKLKRMLSFVDHSGCRHAYILNYFGQAPDFTRCGTCDRCGPVVVRTRRTQGAPVSTPPLDEAQWIVLQKILSCVVRMKGRFGAQRVVQVLRGEEHAALRNHKLHELSTFGLLRTMPRAQILAIIEALQQAGCVVVSPDEYRLLSVTAKGREVLFRRAPNFTIIWPVT